MIDISEHVGCVTVNHEHSIAWYVNVKETKLKDELQELINCMQYTASKCD